MQGRKKLKGLDMEICNWLLYDLTTTLACFTPTLSLSLKIIGLYFSTRQFSVAF